MLRRWHGPLLTLALNLAWSLPLTLWPRQTLAALAPATPRIVTDQFGYRTTAAKIALLREPMVGFDAGTAYTPGQNVQLIEAATGRVVFQHAALPWHKGLVDPASGDRVWWFDFSAVHAPGTYYVLDPLNRVQSSPFAIDDQVYRRVLVQAVRTFFYQRAGFAKEARFAGKDWADKASHVGPGQDRECRRYNAKDDAKTARDLHGGWYDAGDYNKYTSWSAAYTISLLGAYMAAPHAFTDDTGIPESGNGIPDLIDEVKWGLDWLVRMQNADGSVLSIVALASASPPSAATGASYYGSESTSATLSTAAAFAYASGLLRARPQWHLQSYADDLSRRAQRAYAWADSHPRVLFKNNEAASGTLGLGGGQQELDDYDRLIAKLTAASYLYAITGNELYKKFVEEHFLATHLLQWHLSTPYEQKVQEMLLNYSKLPGASASVAKRIREVYAQAISRDLAEEQGKPQPDAYLSYIKEYTWGSNSTKAAQGLVLVNASEFAAAAVSKDAARAAAEGYLHYLHGVNPFGLVYLSNMQKYGAARSVSRVYHTWFAPGSERWGAVKAGAPGPAPGFLTGGPNSSFKIDACCPDQCGGLVNSFKCRSEDLTPPLHQPPMKSYKDFNSEWPLNSWQISENSNLYQSNYIKLLATFVEPLGGAAP